MDSYIHEQWDEDLSEEFLSEGVCPNKINTSSKLIENMECSSFKSLSVNSSISSIHEKLEEKKSKFPNGVNSSSSKRNAELFSSSKSCFRTEDEEGGLPIRQKSRFKSCLKDEITCLLKKVRKMKKKGESKSGKIFVDVTMRNVKPCSS